MGVVLWEGVAVGVVRAVVVTTGVVLVAGTTTLGVVRVQWAAVGVVLCVGVADCKRGVVLRVGVVKGVVLVVVGVLPFTLILVE